MEQTRNEQEARRTFEIPETNMEKLRRKAKTIEKKCEKFGCDFHFDEVGEVFRDVKDEDGTVYTIRYIVVEAYGKAIVNGWDFVAAVEHTQAGNIITGSGTEVPKMYYNRKPVCDHCQCDRARKDTYIIRNTETGEFKQVGRSCLRDFTRGMDVAGVSAWASFLQEAEQAQEYCGGGSRASYLPVDEWLAYVAETVLHFGYVRNQSYDPEYEPVHVRTTAQRASDYWCIDHGRTRYWNKDDILRVKDEMESVSFNAESEEARKLVEEAKAWVFTQSDESNYIHNLQVVCALEYTESRNAGLLTSLIGVYRKDLEKQIERKRKAEADKASEYVGTVGDRITITIKEAKALTSWETMYGLMILWKIVGEDGNVYIWKTGNDIPEDAKSIKGTIKEHSEFNGIKQNVLTRCKVS